MKTRIAINGFGRIGRNLFRLLLNHPTIEVVAINDIADNKTMAHLVKYDSIHGVLNQNVSFSENSIIIDDKSFLFFHEREIKNLDWKSVNVDIVTIGQYLQPSKKHLPVKEYITPEQFAKYEQIGKELGFRHVESGALVRSSYHAEKHIH